MIVTLDQAKAHLRIIGNADDASVTLYLGAAEESAAQYVNRALFTDESALNDAVAAGTDDGSGIVANDAIRAAILLLTGHLYTNREDVISDSRAVAIQLPQGSQFLLNPYRVGNGVC